jgi:hypothetical protein
MTAQRVINQFMQPILYIHTHTILLSNLLILFEVKLILTD